MKRFHKLICVLLAVCLAASLTVTANAAGDTMEQLSASVNGSRVDYWLYTPADAAADMPLIVFLHGGTGARNGAAKLTDASYANLPYYLASDQVNVNAYVLIPYTSATNGFDADTVIALTKLVIEEKGIDPARVSLTGHSMGGTSTWSIALTDGGNVFRRYAPLSGGPANNAGSIAVWQNLSIRTVVGDTGRMETDYNSKTRAVYNAILAGNADADITVTVLEGYEHVDVVQAYLKNTAVSADEGLMDYISFAGAVSEGGEPEEPVVPEEPEEPEITVTKLQIRGKSNYRVGNGLSLRVIATYSDGSSGEVTADLSGCDMSKAGTYTVTASYGGVTATRVITVTGSRSPRR